MPAILRHTYSLCPVCQKKLGAAYIKRDHVLYLEKTCPDHGLFRVPVWNFKISGEAWRYLEPELATAPPCPDACGLCSEHRQDTCCVVLEVTKRCNLACRYCFADGGEGSDVPFTDLEHAFQDLYTQGKTLVQLSGGEPTLRNDLPEIILAAKRAGLPYVQLNTNGLCLAEDPSYAATLADAGLSFVFLQFDGLNPDIYETLRGRDLLEIKKKAIDHCEAVGLGVTLVVTVVQGVNDDHLGDILRFAWENSPTIRGVNFQPVSYFGRIPDQKEFPSRLTLDVLASEIERQTMGVILEKNLFPAKNDHPLCGFHGDFVVTASGLPQALSRPAAACACGKGLVSAVNKREFLAKRWQRKPSSPSVLDTSQSYDLFDLDYFAKRVQSHGFTITAIAFQDAGNLDLERLKHCRLHVYDHGRMVPFCAHYYTPWRDV